MVESSGDGKSVVETYLKLLGDTDFDGIRRLLHPDITFQGPMMAVQGIEDFMNGIQMLGPITERVEVRKLIAEGNHVCSRFDFVTNHEPIGTSRMAEWYTVEGGLIKEIHLYFDPQPWASLG